MMQMIKLRPEQKKLSKIGYDIIKKHKICYLAIEMRVGKTLISFDIADKLKSKYVLFVTKKKAISSIQLDYEAFDRGYTVNIVNYEQLHNVNGIYDLIIIDEATSIGAFPKPSLRTKRLKLIVKDTNLLLLSGTPSPESFSQLYHQFWVSDNSPFNQYTNFYKWSRDFVTVKQRMLNGYTINDYSNANRDKIMDKVNHLFVNFSQKDAGFKGEIKESIEYVNCDKRLVSLSETLLKDRIYEFKNSNGVILADTNVKLRSKLHQIFSGTVIDEDGTAHILDKSKAFFIKDNYSDKKLGIFYHFQAEREVLVSVLGDRIVDTPEEFNNSKSNAIYISQIASGSMGLNLSTADLLVYYNVMFSATQYWQSRMRSQSKYAKDRNIVWLFNNSPEAIETKIKDVLMKKKSFTTYYFKKAYNLDGK